MTSALAQVAAASRIRRPLAALQAGTLLENFANTGSTGTWTVFNSNGSAVKPTTAAPYCTLTSGVTSGNITTISHTGTGVSFGGLQDGVSWVELDLEFPDGQDANDKFQINFSSDGKSTKWIYTSVTFQRSVYGRVTLVLPCKIGVGQWTSQNTEAFDGTTFNYWNINYQKGTTGTARRMILRSITFGATSRPKIVMSYDAGYAGVRDYAVALHDTYNIPGTVNVSRPQGGTYIDSAGFMTTADLQTLHGKGWAMGIRNGATHDTFADLSSLITEMSTARQWNTDRGLTRGADHCIFPVGITSQYSKAALQACGIRTGRTTLSSAPLIAPESGTNDMYSLPTCGLGGTDTFNTNSTGIPVKTTIDRCIALGKSLIIYTHDIGAADTVAAGGISRNDLNAILAYIASYRDAGQCDVMTINDWYDSLCT